MYAVAPSGFFLKSNPIAQLLKLLTTDEIAKANVLPKTTYQEPPKVLFSALLISSLLEDWLQVPEILLAIKNIKQNTRFTAIANIESCVAALGPNRFVTTSIARNAIQENKIPQSNAIQSELKPMLLLASKFIAKTAATNGATSADGTERNKILKL